MMLLRQKDSGDFGFNVANVRPNLNQMFPPFPELEENWREVLALNERVVVFFCASWSPPDKMFSAVLERVAPELDDRIAFFAADLDDEDLPPLFAGANVMTSPQLVYFQRGQPRERTVGYLNEDALRRKLGEWLMDSD